MLRYKTETRPGLVALYESGQETEQVHSYNPGAHGVITRGENMERRCEWEWVGFNIPINTL